MHDSVGVYLSILRFKSSGICFKLFIKIRDISNHSNMYEHILSLFFFNNTSNGNNFVVGERGGRGDTSTNTREILKGHVSRYKLDDYAVCYETIFGVSSD